MSRPTSGAVRVWPALVVLLPLVILLGTLLLLWPFVTDWQNDDLRDPSELAVGQTRTVRMQRIACPRQSDLQTLFRVAGDIQTWTRSTTAFQCRYLPKLQKVVVKDVQGDWVKIDWSGVGEFWTSIIAVTAPCDNCEEQ